VAGLLDPEDEAYLASLQRRQAPAARPIRARNLDGLLAPDAGPSGVAPWSGLPPTPGYTEARVAAPLRADDLQGFLGQTRDVLRGTPAASGYEPSRTAELMMNSLAGPACTVGGGARGIRAFHGSFEPSLGYLDNARLGENFNNRASRAGHWFSTNPDDAAFYGDNIYEAILEGKFYNLPSMEQIGEGVIRRLQNVVLNPNVSNLARQRAEQFLDYVQSTRDPSFYTNAAASEISKARRAGYDGAVLRGGETVQTNSPPGDNYVVFDPNRVRIQGRYEP